jgi:hypothetical protein
MTIRSIHAVALAALALAIAPAQARTTEDGQMWLNATVMQTKPGGFAWFAEVQPRIGNDVSRMQQLLLRPAVGWAPNDKLTLYAGYAHVVLPQENAKDRNEERFFGQASWTIGKIGKGTLSSRSRIEHRLLSHGHKTGWRAREMVRYVHPITTPDKPRMLVSAEGFVALNDTDWGARKGFDQLRSFGGFELPLAGKSTLEIGYLNQLINDPGGQRRVNHVASVIAFIRL